MGVLDFFNIFGSKGGMTTGDLKKMTERSKFSDFLPWLAHDPESDLYINSDNTQGFIWECSPLAFAGEKTQNILKNLIQYPMPEGTILQFTLYADDNIDPFLDAFEALKTRDLPIVRKTTQGFCDFLKNGTKGLQSLSNIPVRNFRLFVSIKFPVNIKGFSKTDLEDTKKIVEETLRGAGLYPRPWKAEALIDCMWRLFNQQKTHEHFHYDDGIPISKQIISAETPISHQSNHLKIGDTFFKCATPKIFPKQVDLMMSNELFGGCWGGGSDGDQIKTPFLYTMNVIFSNQKAALHKKCNLILLQQGFGSLASTLARKQNEFQWATDELEKGTQFLQIIPILWVWHKSEQSTTDAITRIKRIWESHEFVMQEDRGILPILFLSSLPFGLYTQGNNLALLERDFIAQTDAITSIVPVQSDFAGGGKPVIVFCGRKGQVCGIDIFDKHANNHNYFVCATSGGGKSFFVNSLVYNYFASGSIIRIIDIGGSYKKLAKMFNGVYLDFDKSSQVCLNPFSNIRDFKEDVSVVAAIILQMIYSATGSVPPEKAETIMTLIKAAATWAYEEMPEKQNHIDLVYEFLKTFPQHATNENINLEALKELAFEMAYNLSEFTSEGNYGRWVNGKSTLDISNDEFVVLELENLKPQKELFKVITLQIVNAVTLDLYLSDKSRRRLINFDEAWQFLGEGGEMMALEQVINGGYRRARKYGGSFGIITQSPLDLKNFGSIGDVINSNSAFKFFLQSPDFEKAQQEKLIDFDPFSLELLKSTESKKPYYSEIFMETPFGRGVGRLVVDPYSYYVYTSDGAEVAEIESHVSSGMPYEEALAKMVQKYRS